MSAAPYHRIVEDLRRAFPQPVSDPVHDAYFVFSILRALDRVDGMKSRAPVLGEPVELDYDAARRTVVDDEPRTLERVTEEVVDHLNGMFVWGHPRSQVNVVPAPTIPSIVGGLLPSIYNPNLCSDESARRIALAEVEVTAMSADLVGYAPARAGGLFTFGGTGTLLYGLKIGLEKAHPGSTRSGLREPVAILAGERAHYAVQSVANWLGIGEENVVSVPCDDENAIRPCLLETMLRDVVKEGKRVAGIVATMGTTDAFGIDDLEAVVNARDELVEKHGLDYVPHVHADAVIGWAWSVFNDYDIEANPLEFPRRTVRAIAKSKRRIAHLGRSDSLGIDFHKTGFTPYVSSLFLTSDAADLQRIARDESATPYLFQSGEYHPGKWSLETSRSGHGPMAALANLRLFGRRGLQSLLGHLITMSATLREHLSGHEATTVVNAENDGLVTLFRVYPEGVDTFTMPDRERRDPAMREKLREHNAYNRRVFEIVHREAMQGRGVVISMTDCHTESDYGEPVNALKSYVTSPFTDEEYVNAVLASIWSARAEIAATG